MLSLNVSVKTARGINILYTFDIFSGVHIYKFIVCSFVFGTKVHKAAQVLGHTYSTFYDYHMTFNIHSFLVFYCRL